MLKYIIYHFRTCMRMSIEDEQCAKWRKRVPIVRLHSSNKKEREVLKNWNRFFAFWGRSKTPPTTSKALKSDRSQDFQATEKNQPFARVQTATFRPCCFEFTESKIMIVENEETIFFTNPCQTNFRETPCATKYDGPVSIHKPNKQQTLAVHLTWVVHGTLILSCREYVWRYLAQVAKLLFYDLSVFLSIEVCVLVQLF